MKVPLVDLSRQHAQISRAVLSGMAEVMKEGSFIRGPAVAAFEAEFADFSGAKFCVGVGSGTDAIELAARALELSSKDEVLVPANSFIASALGLLRAGIGVRLVDSEPETHLIDVAGVADALSSSVRAVLPVHLYGQMADINSLRAVAGDRFIIEDAAQSQGARQGNLRSGSAGDISATSFYPGKNIGAYGDAGAVVTDSGSLARRVKALGNWGSDVKYHHPHLGFNSRLDSLQAVVLSAKLQRLPEWNEQRRIAASIYIDLLRTIEDVQLPTVLPGNTHVWHLFAVQVDRRDMILERLHKAGIGAGVHYPIPMHLQPALSHLGYGPGSFPVAERAASRLLSLPMFPGITPDEQQFVAGALEQAVRS